MWDVDIKLLSMYNVHLTLHGNGSSVFPDILFGPIYHEPHALTADLYYRFRISRYLHLTSNTTLLTFIALGVILQVCVHI